MCLDKQFIFDYCSKPETKELNDVDITRELLRLKRFKSFNTLSKFGTLRRRVSEIRTFFSLRKERIGNTFYDDLEEMQRKYPDATVLALATKLRLKHNLTVGTIKEYIRSYLKYGIKFNIK